MFYILEKHIVVTNVVETLKTGYVSILESFPWTAISKNQMLC